ncbi:unnamed protein product, partial [Prorocentrum cordatum]
PAAPDAEAPWKKRRRRGAAVDAPEDAPRAAGKAAAAQAPAKAGASDRAAAERVAAQAATAAATAAKKRVEVPPAQRVVVSNIPPSAKVTELADFFTGAIFSATGHTLAAQWQGGEASKVIVGADMLPSGGRAEGRSADVAFGTPAGADVALALNGIQFQGRNLAITRPKNYSGPPSSRAKLQSLTLKDLIASHAAAGAGPSQASSSAWVQLSGIPSSMGSKSVFDLLQQFGGPLKSLDMPESCPGSGVAEYVDRKSALEALKFSPLLGFIEVKAIDAAAAAVLVGRAAAPAVAGSTEGPAAKRLRRTRFDPTPAGAQEADENDLGPFEAALRGRGLPPAAAAPAEDALDLGPFEAVLPKRRSDPDPADDLGPFESVLPPARGPEPEDDLGPFESVLPPRPGAGPAAADGSATEEESRQRPRRTTTWAPSGPRSRASRGKPVVAAGPEASVVRRRAPPLSVLVPIPLLPAAPPAASARAPRGGSWRRRRLQTAARDG